MTTLIFSMQSYVRVTIAGLIFGVMLSFANCSGQNPPKQVENNPPQQAEAEDSIAIDEARQLSDAVADDLINQRMGALREKAERLLRDQVDEKAFARMVEQMYDAYGQPMEFEFKQVEPGAKANPDGRSKNLRKFWYAARTSKAEKGTYFLFVEVVNDGPKLAFSSFAIVSFQGEVPQNLR